MGAGALGLGGMLGKGGGDQDTPAASQYQEQIARQLFAESSPLRGALMANSMNFMGVPAAQQQAGARQQAGGDKAPLLAGGGGGQMYTGGSQGFYGPGGAGRVGGAGTSRPMDVRNTQAGQAYKFMADSAFQNAMNNTTGRFARGGPLEAAMTNLEAQRAGALTQGYGQLWGDEYNRAFQLGTGMIPATMTGLGQAGSVQAQIAQANAAQNAAGKGALGGAAGAYFGSKA